MANKPESNPISNSTFSSQSSSKVHPTDDPEVDPNSYLLEKFKLYETRAVLKIPLVFALRLILTLI